MPLTTWLQCKNNAQTTLAANLTIGASSMTVTSEATLPTTFPYRLTIWDNSAYGEDDPSADPNMEIVEVTRKEDYYGGQDYDYGNLLTITRAQESTAAAAHNSGDRVRLCITAGIITQIQAAITALETP